MIGKIGFIMIICTISVHGVMAQQKDNETFEINGKIVTQKVFESFFARLKEIPDTWYCKKTTTGGRTGFDARDTITNMIYRYTSSVDNGQSKSSLKQKENIKKTEEIYEIDNKLVSSKEFKQFLSGLKEIPGTWFCKKTLTGGISGYDVKDTINNITYIYNSYFESGNQKSKITKKTK